MNELDDDPWATAAPTASVSQPYQRYSGYIGTFNSNDESGLEYTGASVAAVHEEGDDQGVPARLHLERKVRVALEESHAVEPALQGDVLGVQDQFPQDQLRRGEGKPLPFPAFRWLRRKNELAGHFPILPLTIRITVVNSDRSI